MNVLSLSIDSSIVTENGDARYRQQQYSSHFDSYTVIVKTNKGNEEFIKNKSLTIIPTCSLNRYLFLLDAYRIAARRCRTANVDVVTVQDPFAIGLLGWILKRQFGVQLHTQVHTDFLENDVWRTASCERRVFTRLGRFVLPHADAIRVGTEHERKKVSSLVSDDIPIHVSPVRVDLESVTGADMASVKHLRSELDISDRPVVLFVGRFVSAKDLQCWVRVAEQTRERTATDPVFVLVGDGPERGRLEQKTSDAGLDADVRLPGWTPRDELAAYYQLANIFLITSKFEGTSRVVVEAGMNELPIVATPFAGAHDNIRTGETGFVVNDEGTMADKLTWLLEHPDEASRMGQEARELLVDRFHPDRLVKEYVETIQAADQ